MDEQRLQAYVSLIEQLLSYPRSQEKRLLQVNTELVDAGLLTVIEQYATRVENKGDGSAERLREIGVQIKQLIQKETAASEVEEDLVQSFSVMLQQIAEHKGNPQQIYPIWATQQAFFNQTLLESMPAIAVQLFERNAEQLTFVAALLGAFGDLIQQFPLGRPGLNLELSIAAYQEALTVRTKSEMPIKWADTTNNLAMAYRDRIQGSRSENLERAITACHQVLKVRTKSTLPVEWAQTTSGLASIYLYRIQGDRAENLEQSIAAYQQALTVLTQHTRPADWAQVMSDLGNAYLNRIKGERAENIEQAISNYRQALTVRTKGNMPLEWALTLVNLSGAYSTRVRGDRAENIEQAIAACKQALEVLSQSAMPVEWAGTKTNLATAYLNRVRGERAENIEQAISTYQQALSVITQHEMPRDWAETKMNLATAYLYRIRGERGENLEQAIAGYQQALTVMTKSATPINWATSMHNLANAYLVRIKGNRADNLEQATAICQQALTVRTQEAMPTQWATTMIAMASALSLRIKGNRSENIEQSISTYQQALSVITQHSMPREWATATSNLAVAYRDRIEGDLADNIEQSIAASKQALTVMTQEVMPTEWARMMMNLASAYLIRIRGVRADNIEQSIAYCRHTLTVRTQETMPIDWADTMGNLANAYLKRIKGDRAENYEQAISLYKQILAVITQEAMPIEWAQIHINLSDAYLNRVRGDHAENCKQAIKASEQALTVITKDTIPLDWAKAMMNLANAHYYSPVGSSPVSDSAESFEQAISSYQQALTVLTKEAMPTDWARATMNLGNAYLDRIKGERSENLEQAINCYQQALTVRTQSSMPVEWAKTMTNLAIAYADRVQGDRAENIEQAIATYQASLDIYDPELFPHDCRRAARNLSNLYSEQKRWKESIPVYQKALKAAEVLYQSANLLDGKTAELAETADIPRCAAYAHARCNNLSQALEIIERGRARGLSESLDRDRASLAELEQTHSVLYTQYVTVTEQLRALEDQQRERIISTDRYTITPERLRENVTTLRQQLNTLIQSIRKVSGYENFLALPTFEDVQQAADKDCPLIYLLSTPAGGLALSVRSENVQSIWLDNLTEDRLTKLLNKDWFTAYRQSKKNLQSWLTTVDAVTRQLWEPLMKPLVQYLKSHDFNQAILVPTGYLSFLPLHTAWIKDETRLTGRQYAFDDIHFTYAPNAKSLTAAASIAEQVHPHSILAIDNPRQDLPNAEREVKSAINRFSDRTVLRHGEATVNAVKSQLTKAAIAHFSCHGTANLTEPLNSGLVMSDGLLTLKDIFALNLTKNGGLRLAILSACETSLQGTENADEAVSLPTGLLQAGVAAVISSLWEVSDLSSMILLTRVYDVWQTEGLEISQALWRSQQWVRDTTNEQKYDYLKGTFQKLADNQRMEQQAVDELLREFMLQYTFLDGPQARSFAHPFHWAAFTYVGV